MAAVHLSHLFIARETGTPPPPIRPSRISASRSPLACLRANRRLFRINFRAVSSLRVNALSCRSAAEKRVAPSARHTPRRLRMRDILYLNQILSQVVTELLLSLLRLANRLSLLFLFSFSPPPLPPLSLTPNGYFHRRDIATRGGTRYEKRSTRKTRGLSRDNLTLSDES